MPHRSPLALIERAATEILTLVGEMEEYDFLATRLTRAEAVKRLARIAAAAAALPPSLREAMPEVDWAAWAAHADVAPPDAVWHAIADLTPTTLQWLRVYRAERPELFAPAS